MRFIIAAIVFIFACLAATCNYAEEIWFDDNQIACDQAQQKSWGKLYPYGTFTRVVRSLPKTLRELEKERQNAEVTEYWGYICWVNRSESQPI